MKIQRQHWFGIIVGIVIVAVDIWLFLGHKSFYFLLTISAIIMALPFLVSVMLEVGKEKEKEEMFLEFTRNLVESAVSGTPISRSILNVRDKDFGSLTPHVKKLANQVALGIPVKKAFAIFASDTRNKVIARSVDLISEAERSGGEIGSILESVAKSVSETEDIKKERKSAMFSTILEMYILFFIFIIIMLVVQIKLIPMLLQTLGVATGPSFPGLGGLGGEEISLEVLQRIFLILILVQGFFAGLVTGKLSEQSFKAGIKHSAIFIALAALIVSGVQWLM